MSKLLPLKLRHYLTASAGMQSAIRAVQQEQADVLGMSNAMSHMFYRLSAAAAASCLIRFVTINRYYLLRVPSRCMI